MPACGMLVTFHQIAGRHPDFPLRPSLQFADASSLLLNAKDKALNLGPQAKLTGPINRLPNVDLVGETYRQTRALFFRH